MTTTFKNGAPYRPTNSGTESSNVIFKACSPFSQELVHDYTIIDVPFNDFNIGTGASALVTFASGTVAWEEINTCGVAGLSIAADKNEVEFAFGLPIDMDPDIGVAVRYRIYCPLAYTTAASCGITTDTYWRLLNSSTTASKASVQMSSSSTETYVSSVTYGLTLTKWTYVNDSAMQSAAPLPGDDEILISTRFTLDALPDSTVCYVRNAQVMYYKRYQR